MAEPTPTPAGTAPETPPASPDSTQGGGPAATDSDSTRGEGGSGV
jgi:hypothetical protein